MQFASIMYWICDLCVLYLFHSQSVIRYIHNKILVYQYLIYYIIFRYILYKSDFDNQYITKWSAITS
jgi:hypothetical protein